MFRSSTCCFGPDTSRGSTGAVKQTRLEEAQSAVEQTRSESAQAAVRQTAPEQHYVLQKRHLQTTQAV